jgi:hypothetical protein
MLSDRTREILGSPEFQETPMEVLADRWKRNWPFEESPTHLMAQASRMATVAGEDIEELDLIGDREDALTELELWESYKLWAKIATTMELYDPRLGENGWFDYAMGARLCRRIRVRNRILSRRQHSHGRASQRFVRYRVAGQRQRSSRRATTATRGGSRGDDPPSSGDDDPPRHLGGTRHPALARHGC